MKRKPRSAGEWGSWDVTRGAVSVVIDSKGVRLLVVRSKRVVSINLTSVEWAAMRKVFKEVLHIAQEL